MLWFYSSFTCTPTRIILVASARVALPSGLRLPLEPMMSWSTAQAIGPFAQLATLLAPV